MTRKRIIGQVLAALAVGFLIARLKHATGDHTTIDVEFQRLRVSLALWVAFFAYWAFASRNQAPSQRSESVASTSIHQVALASALVLLFLEVPGLTGWFIPPQWHLAVPIGIALQTVSLLLAVWARRHLGRNWAAEVRIGEGHELVRSGPYRWIRHPIYTAMLGMFTGSAIASGQYHAVLGVIILFIAYIRKTRLEEEILSRTFPTDYEAYRRSTWRLVPPIF